MLRQQVAALEDFQKNKLETVLDARIAAYLQEHGVMPPSEPVEEDDEDEEDGENDDDEQVGTCLFFILDLFCKYKLLFGIELEMFVVFGGDDDGILDLVCLMWTC